MAEAPEEQAPVGAGASTGARAGEGATALARLRLGALVAFVLLVAWGGAALGLREHLSAQALRATLEGAGALGILVFVIAFVAGQVLYVPGMVFVAAAVFVWGPVSGFLLGYLAGNLSVNLHFLLLRWIGGRPLATSAPGRRWRWVQRQIEGLERHPVRVVVLLRLVAFMAPALNTLLALTSLRARDHLIGTAIGLVLPIAAACGLFQWIFG